MWQQTPDPIGHLTLSALVAAVPIVFLFWALAVRRMRGHLAGLWTTGLAVVVAVLAFGMPVRLALAATIHGALYGLFPIGWIVLAAVFLYRVTVETGQFEIIKDSIAAITEDRRIQALLIAFSFGAFLEGAAGFGTPVAISAAMLMGLGFEPVSAAGLCLLANTAPVAFGAIGTPVVVAGQVSGIDAHVISQMVGRQLPFLSVLIPFWLVATMSGWRGVKEVWPAALVSGATFALAQFWTSNTLGPLLPDIISAICSIVALVAFLRFWKPRTIFRFEHDQASSRAGARPLSAGAVIKAWSPFVVLTILVANWGSRPVKTLLDHLTVAFPVPVLHEAVINSMTGKPIPSVFTFNWLSATGTVILLTGLVTVVATRMAPRDAMRLFGRTARSLTAPLVTIAAVLGFAYIGNASGMMTTMGLALAETGRLFPLFSPLLGWLGVFMTGSDTSANAVFGRLQRISAEQIGMNPVLAVAANSSGGVTGKMISPQSIAVACGATGLQGHEPALFRFAVWHSLALVGLLGLLTWAQATVLSWMVPALSATSSLAPGGTVGAGETTGLVLLGTSGLLVGALAAWARRR